MAIDRSYIDKDQGEKAVSIHISLTREERDIINKQATREGFDTLRGFFLKRIALDYCRLKTEMYNKEKEVERIFIEDYSNLRKEYLEKLNKFKEYREQMLQMDTQDEGEDPFDEDDLVD